MDVEDEKKWKECFTVEGVFLPTGYFFGLTAATGDLAGKLVVHMNLFLDVFFFPAAFFTYASICY